MFKEHLSSFKNRDHANMAIIIINYYFRQECRTNVDCALRVSKHVTESIQNILKLAAPAEVYKYLKNSLNFEYDNFIKKNVFFNIIIYRNPTFNTMVLSL